MELVRGPQILLDEVTITANSDGEITVLALPASLEVVTGNGNLTKIAISLEGSAKIKVSDNSDSLGAGQFKWGNSAQIEFDIQGNNILEFSSAGSGDDLFINIDYPSSILDNDKITFTDGGLTYLPNDLAGESFYTAITNTGFDGAVWQMVNTPGIIQFGVLTLAADRTWTLPNASGTMAIENYPFVLKVAPDSAAPNNSLYYSSDSLKPVYKDPGGTVNDLY